MKLKKYPVTTNRGDTFEVEVDIKYAPHGSVRVVLWKKKAKWWGMDEAVQVKEFTLFGSSKEPDMYKPVSGKLEPNLDAMIESTLKDYYESIERKVESERRLSRLTAEFFSKSHYHIDGGKTPFEKER